MFLTAPCIAAVSSTTAASDASSTVARDLGFSQWETSTPVESFSNRYFEVYRAKPRGRRLPYGFLLKALRSHYCLDAALGAKLVERERFVGSFNSERVLPSVDWRYPERVSATHATRGYVVTPYMPGVTLRQALRTTMTLDGATLRQLTQALRELVSDLAKNGWGLSSLSSDQLFVATYDAPGAEFNSFPYLALHDYSTAYMFATPSLFSSNYAESTCADDNFAFSPDAFYSSRVSLKSTSNMVAQFLQELNQTTLNRESWTR